MSIENIITNVRSMMKAWGIKVDRSRPAPTFIVAQDGESWGFDGTNNIVRVGSASSQEEALEYLHHELVHLSQPTWMADYFHEDDSIDFLKYFSNEYEVQAMFIARAMAESWYGEAVKDLVGSRPWRHYVNAHRKVGAAMAIVSRQCGETVGPQEWLDVRRLLPSSNKMEVMRQLQGREPKKKLTRRERKAIQRIKKKLGG